MCHSLSIPFMAQAEQPPNGGTMTEPNNYAVVTVSKITGYSFHGDFVLTKEQAQTIADQLNVEWPDFMHTIKQEGEA
jgi:hypothetical protein